MQVTDHQPVTDPAVYKPTLDYLFDVFGENKLVFGSDWPNGNAVENLPGITIVQEYPIRRAVRSLKNTSGKTQQLLINGSIVTQASR